MKSIRFDIPDDLHQKIKIKLAKEGRQQKELFLTLTELYVGEDDGKEKKDRPKKNRPKK